MYKMRFHAILDRALENFPGFFQMDYFSIGIFDPNNNLMMHKNTFVLNAFKSNEFNRIESI